MKNVKALDLLNKIGDKESGLLRLLEGAIDQPREAA